MKKTLLFFQLFFFQLFYAQSPADPTQYCNWTVLNPLSNNTGADERIGRVQIVGTTLNNASNNCNRYTNFTSIITRLNPGQNYAMVVNGYEALLHGMQEFQFLLIITVIRYGNFLQKE